MLCQCGLSVRSRRVRASRHQLHADELGGADRSGQDVKITRRREGRPRNQAHQPSGPSISARRGVMYRPRELEQDR